MNELAVQQSAPSEMTVKDVQTQIIKIQELMTAVMKVDEHYGVIPGTGKKPSLLKPGAEKINFIFRLEPEYEIQRHELPEGHREFEIKCTLRQIGTGTKVGEGVGSCSTMESKYRYRNVADYEILDAPIPKDSKERKAEYRKQGFGMKQVDGAWYWVKYTSSSKADNPDIADVYNTVLKMAKKRAYVDATLTATAASDFFTQDVEDFAEPEKKAGLRDEQEPRVAEGQETSFADRPQFGPENPLGNPDPAGMEQMARDIRTELKMNSNLWAGVLAAHNGKIEGEGKDKHWVGVDWSAVLTEMRDRKLAAARAANMPDEPPFEAERKTA